MDLKNIKRCEVCYKELKFNSVKMLDGVICTGCFNSLNLNDAAVVKITIEDSKKRMALITRSKELLKVFRPTKTIKKVIEFDFNNKLIYLPKEEVIYEFEEILDVKIVGNENPQTNGVLGTTIVGALIFGAIGLLLGNGIILAGIGAIVGSIIGSKKSYVDKLYVMLTFEKNSHPPTYIKLIQYREEVNTSNYKKNYSLAQEICNIFKNVFHSREASNSELRAPELDVASEIRKFKLLLDDGIISEEEFQQKKEKLLKL